MLSNSNYAIIVHMLSYKTTLIALAALAVILLALEVYVYAPEPPAAVRIIPAPALIIGDPNAKVTLVEYGDFHCSSCGEFFQRVEPQIRKNYVNGGKVRIEYRVYPWVSADSVRAGVAAYCAGDQGKFAPFHDELYRSQGAEDAMVFIPDRLKKMAGQLGLDAAAFNACYDSGRYAAKVNNGVAEAQAMGVTATPTFFIGGKRVVGAQSYATFKVLIDAQL
jgi:protein-disulfide isomerase